MLLTESSPRRLRGLAVGGPAFLVVFSVVGTLGAAQRQTGDRALDAAALLLVVAAPVVLLWLDRRPVAVMWTTLAITLVYLARGYAYGPILLSAAVAVFVTLLQGHRRAAWAGVAALYVGHVAVRAWIRDAALTWGQLLGVAAWCLVVVSVAETTRVRRERALAASAARREGARRRDNEERLRIARDLHDVVAHHMSLINVQAGVALHLVDRRPDQVETALRVIKDASKEALTELRSLVGLLREEGVAPRAPTPMLDSLDALVERASLAGLAVTTSVEGSMIKLPAAVELSAFRLLQEAVTNVVRHASATEATIRLEYAADVLVVQVDDNGVGLTGTVGDDRADDVGDAPVGGSGIAGMRERAAALGGALTVTSSPAGGTRVRATLPLGASG